MILTKKYCSVVFMVLITLLLVKTLILSPITLPLSYLCDVKQENLQSMIWSHRASFNSLVDGSREAVYSLIKVGIKHFDIDVSIINNEHNFYVAHPSISNLDFNVVQSLSSFLDQVFLDKLSSISMDTYSEYFITVEPKFDDVDDMLMLVALLESHSLNAQLAIIVRDKRHLMLIEPLVKHISIAIPFKSGQAHSPPPGFSWNHSADYIKSKRILMPDIKVLKEYVHHNMHIASNTIPVIPWIVDSKEDIAFIFSIDVHVTGFITNRPLEMLQYLRNYYDDVCIT